MPASLIPPREYSMKHDGVEKNILNHMNQERKVDGPSSCEVILLVNEVKHYAHKIVLVSFSEFFRGYFEENTKEKSMNGKDSNVDSETDGGGGGEVASRKSHATSESSENEVSSVRSRSQVHTTIKLPGINSEELEPILDYMYTSQLVLRADNVNEILFVGCLLQITSVVEFCAEVLYQQPTWRSPLVSPKLFNYVTDHVSRVQREDVVSSSPTAVTWATSGGRPASHEIKPRSRRRIGRSNVQSDDSNRPAGPSGQSHIPVAPPRGSRKRRHHESQRSSQPHDGRRGRTLSSNGRGFEVASMRTPTVQEQQQEYLANIDFAELDRELTRNAQIMNSRRYRSQRNNVPHGLPISSYQTCAPPPSVDVRSYGVKHNSQVSSSADKLVPGTFDSLYHGSRDEVESAQSRKFSVENQTITMFPQLSDSNRNLQAMCFPTFHPGYFGFPAMNPISRLVYPTTFPGVAFQGPTYENASENDLSKAAFIGNQTKSFEERISPHRRFIASIDGIQSNQQSSLQGYSGAEFRVAPSACRRPAEVRDTQSSISQDYTSIQSNRALYPSVFKENRICSEVPTGHLLPPGAKRFCPDIIQHVGYTSDEEGNTSQEAKELSTPSSGTLNPSGNRQVEKHRVAKGNFMTANSGELRDALPSSREKRNEETCGTSSTIQSCFNPQDHVTARKPNHVDYHKRKRKLLRAVEELRNYEKVKQVEKCDSIKPTHNVQKSHQQKTKCSSEDDIIARECHHPDASDLDSDDSGRPSSV